VKNKKLFAILTLVCFMFTLMPVAAFAAGDDLDANASYLVMNAGETNVLTDATTESIDYTIHFETVDGTVPTGFNADATGGYEGDNGMYLYIWAEENGVVSPKLETPVVTNAAWADAIVTESTTMKNVWALNKVQEGATITLEFAKEGVFTIHAGYGVQAEDKVSEIAQFGYVDGNVTVYGDTANPEDHDMVVTRAGYGVQAAANGFDAYVSPVTANNVTTQLTLTFDNNGDELVGKTVTAKSDSANLSVNPATQTTNVLGQVKLNVSAAREGVYTIYVNIDGRTFTIGVNCGNTAAAYIETTEQPENKVALFDDPNGLIAFTITDINGNAVTDLAAGCTSKGADGLCKTSAQQRQSYLQFIQKPADSNLTNADLSLDFNDDNGEYYVNFAKASLNAEGKYVVRAILDNGAVAMASFEVKAFETPVELKITAPATVELGATVAPTLKYLDANGVQKSADDAKLAATGYAIYSTTPAANGISTIKVKTDEKYTGSVIKLTAVSEMYDLVSTKDVKVAAEAVAIEFANTDLEVDVNNKVKWNVVDEDGEKVTLTNVSGVEVKYVVLDKPADAKVSVYDLSDDGVAFDGDGVMAITSNKVGVVKVQAIAQVELKTQTLNDNNDVVDLGTQTKYYTAVQEFAIGMDGNGDVLVMSIGSDQYVINDEVKAMDGKAVIKNSRTFVPLRTGLEALGATVAWDEATQSVTAEMNGVKVVMTIGSAAYTVNGVEKVADVAPYIDAAANRTMVPASFAAKAFGMTVNYTTNDDGSVADVIFAN